MKFVIKFKNHNFPHINSKLYLLSDIFIINIIDIFIINIIDIFIINIIDILDVYLDELKKFKNQSCKFVFIFF